MSENNFDVSFYIRNDIEIDHVVDIPHTTRKRAEVKQLIDRGILSEMTETPTNSYLKKRFESIMIEELELMRESLEKGMKKVGKFDRYPPGYDTIDREIRRRDEEICNERAGRIARNMSDIVVGTSGKTLQDMTDNEIRETVHFLQDHLEELFNKIGGYDEGVERALEESKKEYQSRIVSRISEMSDEELLDYQDHLADYADNRPNMHYDDVDPLKDAEIPLVIQEGKKRRLV